MRGYPILGDSKYRILDNYRKNKKFLMLHAYKLYFKISNEKYNFSADLPLEFKETLKEKYLKIF